MAYAGNKKYVTASKPKVGGAVHVAPKGTLCEKSATAKLDETFRALGYISEDGVTNNNSPSFETTRAWGGDEVLHYQTEKPDIFKLTLIEGLNPEVLATVYGAANVQGSIDDVLIVAANTEEQEGHAWVIDTVMKGGFVKRIYIPDGIITAIEEIVYNGSTPVGYGITITAAPNDSGDTHYEYISTSTQASADPEAEN